MNLVWEKEKAILEEPRLVALEILLIPPMFGSLSIGRLPVVNTLSNPKLGGLFSLDNADQILEDTKFWQIPN